MLDELSRRYEDLLAGSYDCIDRIVLNANFRMACLNSSTDRTVPNRDHKLGRQALPCPAGWHARSFSRSWGW